MVKRNFHINSTANGTEKITVINHIAHVDENGLLKIHLYWAGKGSSGDPPDFNGPLLSAISVTPGTVTLLPSTTWSYVLEMTSFSKLTNEEC